MSDALLSIRTVKALRKARRCVWCPEVLPAGSGGVCSVQVWDGQLQTMYLHVECNEAQLRDPCRDDEGCQYAHDRGKTCAEMEDALHGGCYDADSRE